MRCMSSDRIDAHASGLLNAARDLQEAAGAPGSSEATTAALASLETALQALSAAWYQVAADAAPGIASRRRRLAESPKAASGTGRHVSHEQEVRLVVTLHDVAGAFARCARACRHAQPVVRPLIDGVVSAGRADFQGVEAVERSKQRVA